MKAANDNKRWDRGNLKEWQASLPEERLRDDRKKLSRIFNLAAKVPELKDALDWARDHDIEFIVDRKANAGGYYTIGTGVVALVENAFLSDATAVGVMVHEVRHAWQDYYGMLPTTGKSFHSYFMRLGVVEADATAHQTLAMEQYSLSTRIETMRELSGPAAAERAARLQREFEDKDAEQKKLWQAFDKWYRGKVSYYWRSCKNFAGNRLGIPGVTFPGIQPEYSPYEGRKEPQIEGIDITRVEQLRRLGKGFKRGNYFNVASRDAFAREYFSPSRAEVCYAKPWHGQKSVKIDKTISEIRRRQLLLKRHRGFEVLL